MSCEHEDSSRPTLVLGHSLGSSHRMWDELLPLLTPWLQVYTYDLPGHGDSPSATDKLQMKDIVYGLAAALDEQEIDDIHIAGLSFGGLVALSAPHFLGERIRSVTTMASGPSAGSPTLWHDRVKSVEENGVEPLINDTMIRWFSDVFRQGRGAARVQDIERIYAECDPQGYIQCCDILGSTDARPWLSELTSPVLVMAGSEDAGFNAEACHELVQHMRDVNPAQDIHSLVIGGARHMLAIEYPHLVAGALINHVLTA
nr:MULTISPECIES: alpha/beta fold hydrolase [unclassified Schaalia]